MNESQLQVVFSATVFGWSLIIVYLLARKGRLSFRYTIGWVGLFFIGLAGSFSLRMLEPIADWLEITPAAVLAVGGVSILVVICIQLSISISGLQSQVRRLTEEIALVVADHEAHRDTNHD